MWRCPRCETINQNEHEYCGVCGGEKVINRSPDPAEHRPEVSEARPEPARKRSFAVLALVAGVFALGFGIAFFLSRGDEPASNRQDTSEVVQPQEIESDMDSEPEPEVEEPLTGEEIWAKAMEAEDYIESYSNVEVSTAEWIWSFEGEDTTTLVETWIEGEVIVNDQERLLHALVTRTRNGEESVIEQFLKREGGVNYFWTNYNGVGWTKNIRQRSDFDYFDATSSAILLGEETIDGTLTYKLEVGLSRDFIDAINLGEAENSDSVWSFLDYGTKAIVYVDQSTFYWVRFEVDSPEAMERHFLSDHELDDGWIFSAVQDHYIIKRTNFNEIEPFGISEEALRVGVNPFNLDVLGRENVIQIERGDVTLLVPFPEGANDVDEGDHAMLAFLESEVSEADDILQTFLVDWSIADAAFNHVDEAAQWDNTIDMEYRIHQLENAYLVVVYRTFYLIDGEEHEQVRYKLYQEYEGYTLVTIFVFARGDRRPEFFSAYGFDKFFEAGILTWDGWE